jgi:hypothetical protein
MIASKSPTKSSGKINSLNTPGLPGVDSVVTFENIAWKRDMEKIGIG